MYIVCKLLLLWVVLLVVVAGNQAQEAYPLGQSLLDHFKISIPGHQLYRLSCARRWLLPPTPFPLPLTAYLPFDTTAQKHVPDFHASKFPPVANKVFEDFIQAHRKGDMHALAGLTTEELYDSLKVVKNKSCLCVYEY